MKSAAACLFLAANLLFFAEARRIAGVRAAIFLISANLVIVAPVIIFIFLSI